MNKTVLILGLIASFAFNTNAQTKNLGNPPSWSISANALPSFDLMPAVNVQEQLDIDAQNKANGYDKILRFGYEHHVQIDVLENGNTINDGLGGIITQYGVECPEALSVNLIFDEFELADGAELFIYNSDKSQFIGAHTSENNNVAKVLGTDLIKGSKIIIELYEPAGTVGLSTLVLGTVVHGYLDLPELVAHTMKDLNESGNCNVDVNCPAGDGWENQRNSVAMLITGASLCSGSLVNCVTNTIGDVTPYFLTANHCNNGTNFMSTVFRFRWESPVNGTSCATTANSSNGPTNLNVNGSTLRAANGNADFVLLELNAEPDPAWDIFYNGYNMTDDPVVQAVGIHHPLGDIKKIAIEYQAPTKQTTNFNGTANADFWRIADWDVGVTEQGSSGSPLFDEYRRTVGVLSAGAAACNGTSDNNQYDIYGRLGIAWDEKPAPGDQLKYWLDPEGTGNDIVHGFDPILGEVVGAYAGITAEKEAELIALYPNPTNGIFTLTVNSASDKTIKIINALGQTVYTKNTLKSEVVIDATDFPTGVYVVSIQTENKRITKRLIVK
ncbi:MAG: T9SS type A sorting domain-containing protein [Lishizhenia sp.]